MRGTGNEGGGGKEPKGRSRKNEEEGNERGKEGGE